jgi:hypothetical protein
VYDGFIVLTHQKARPAPKAAAKVAAKAAAAPATAPARKAARRKAAPADGPPAAPKSPGAVPDKVAQILQALPELARGEAVELQAAGERLRKAGVLSRSGSSKKLLGQFADRFELLPAGQPTRVVVR